jgi:hypothetical protein
MPVNRANGMVMATVGRVAGAHDDERGVALGERFPHTGAESKPVAC